MNDFTQAINGLGAGESLTLGAGRDADVRCRGADARHARIVRHRGSLFIQDLDSSSGTFVNDREVRGLVGIQGGDRLRIGETELSVETAAAPESGPGPEPKGLPVTFQEATIRVSTRGGPRAILDRLSLHVPAGSFVGILGASGSGKSTLIKTIAGLNHLSDGEILLAGAAAAAPSLRQDRRIAYLPQDVVIHESLMPRTALGYIARLKNLAHGSGERRELIQEALARVGLGERLDVPVRQLSGGQRKRVALAAELLGDPQVILLDEATSGLDPATEAEMMRLFRSLADEGRTVICITHFPDRLALCDRVVYLMEGQSVFYGAPEELTRFFGTATIEEVYVRQSERSCDEWRSAFEASPAGRRAAELLPDAAQSPPALPASPREPAASTQTLVLTRRYLNLQLADWPNVFLQLIQAPIIALMIAATYGSIGASFAELHAARTKETIFLLVLAMLWCAGTVGVRELVKEQTILRHETRFGVRLLPYLLSKLIPLCGLALIQAVALLWVVRDFTGLSGPFLTQLLVLSFTAFTGVALGLLVSSFAGTSERAMTILPVLLIAQAVFSGGLARLEGFVKFASQAMIPAYWALDGFRSTFGSDLTAATYPGAPGHYQPPIMGRGGPLLVDLLALVVQSVVISAVALYFLRRGSGRLRR